MAEAARRRKSNWKDNFYGVVAREKFEEAAPLTG